jgi:hypothetical protein
VVHREGVLVMMKRSALVMLLVIGLLVSFAAPSYAWHHGRGGVYIGVGPGYWWGPPYPYWSPAVVIQQPPVYVEQQPPPAPPAYWYYCPSAQAYYPQVPTCPEAWLKVSPSTR